MKIVANDLTSRFENLMDNVDKEDSIAEQSPVPAATHDVNKVTFIGDPEQNTIDLVGEPAIKSFFNGYDGTKQRDPSPNPISTGTDFHKTYVPPATVKKNQPLPKLNHKTNMAMQRKSPEPVASRRNHPVKAYNSRVKDSHTVVLMDTPDVSDEDSETQQSNHQRSNKMSPSRNVSTQADFHK